MHVPDGFVSGSLNLIAGAASAAVVGVCAWRASREAQRRPATVPLLATTAAFVFAAQMLNFPIGGGTSGHFLGAAAATALLGPSSACLVMTIVLAIQCLGFADGGLTALGTNVLNMGVIGCFGSYVIMRGMRFLLPGGRGGFLSAVAVASWASIVLAAAACALELALSGTSPLGLVLLAMVGTHAIIGIGEALITVAVLSAVMAARPDVLPAWAGIGEVAAAGARKKKTWTLVVAGLAVALVLAAFASPFASSSPDGLEKVAEKEGFIESAENKEVWKHSPMPDYAVPGAGSEAVSTGLAGLVGTAAIFAVGFGVIRLLGGRPHRRET